MVIKITFANFLFKSIWILETHDFDELTSLIFFTLFNFFLFISTKKTKCLNKKYGICWFHVWFMSLATTISETLKENERMSILPIIPFTGQSNTYCAHTKCGYKYVYRIALELAGLI